MYVCVCGGVCFICGVCVSLSVHVCVVCVVYVHINEKVHVPVMIQRPEEDIKSITAVLTLHVTSLSGVSH